MTTDGAMPRVRPMSHARTSTTARRATPAGPLPRTIVTGASSGIGRALALELARCGVPVLAVARQAEPLQALTDAHGLIEPWVADLSRIEEMDGLAAQLSLIHI